jgi:hypothetical protein
MTKRFLLQIFSIPTAFVVGLSFWVFRQMFAGGGEKAVASLVFIYCVVLFLVALGNFFTEKLFRPHALLSLGAALIVVGAFAWWVSQTPTYVHRFRLTIEAESEGVVRTGAGVIEVHTTDNKVGTAETAGLRSHVLGDAVFLDLGGGRNVIALLVLNPHGTREIELLDFHAFRAINPRLQIADLPKLAGRAPLPGNLMPTLVTFTDPTDSKSAREIGFTEFESVFGPDVHFKGAWIEMTKDPVTRGIDKRLPWIATMKAKGLGGQIYTHPGRFTVNVPYFTREK